MGKRKKSKYDGYSMIYPESKYWLESAERIAMRIEYWEKAAAQELKRIGEIVASAKKEAGLYIAHAEELRVLLVNMTAKEVL